MPGASAVSAVLLFRLATFWLPVPLGWLAYAWMQRRDWL
jgi:glycosyltransferase 2 family protein